MTHEAEALELERIRGEYERRSRTIAGDFYGWRRPANYFLFVQTARACIRKLDRCGFYPFTNLRVADVGCGRGAWLLEFAQWGADPENLAGIDLDEGRVASARKSLPGADLRMGSAGRLPWTDAAFDVV
ncbi:MAG TPA: class I SAM-dependent methyltransferase, partial [Bryobacteraceae bacterium]